MPIPIIVFDLDGTLIDTAPDLVDSLNAVFARRGYPAVPYEAARTMIGGGPRVMIKHAVEAQNREYSPDVLDDLYRDFVAHYAEHIAERSRPFPFLIEALDALTNEGHRFAVCTNKLERLSVMLLKELRLAHRFAAICGQDTFGMQKPNPEMLRRTIAAAGGSPQHAIMVGDSLTDIRTARGAGVPVIAVDFGYTDRPVTELDPDRVISGFDQLPAAIAALCAAN